MSGFWKLFYDERPGLHEIGSVKTINNKNTYTYNMTIRKIIPTIISGIMAIDYVRPSIRLIWLTTSR